MDWMRFAPAAWMMAALALAGPATAQTGDWRSAAPVLPLQGAIRPITAPVAIGGAGWGPWRSICREQTTRPGRPPERNCLTVAEIRPEAGGTRLILVQDGTGLRISALRGTDGRMMEFAALRPDGTAPPADEGRDALLAAWRDKFATLSVQSQRLGNRQIFELPVTGSPRGMPCRVEGASAIAQRQVVVATCALELAGPMGRAGAPMEVIIAGRMAVDVATGVVVNQSYATRIERLSTTPEGRRSSVGVVVTPSRVFLE